MVTWLYNLCAIRSQNYSGNKLNVGAYITDFTHAFFAPNTLFQGN